MKDDVQKTWRLFNRTLVLFLLLGVIPILLVAIAFALPIEWEIHHYKTFIGLLLIFATVSTLCLAGLVTRLLKHPINQLLVAQQNIQKGDLNVRLPIEGSAEIQTLFSEFNHMVEEVQKAQEKEKLYAEQRSLAKLATQVAHDLRSPLSSLKVVSECLSPLKVDHPDWLEYTELLELSSKRITRIADDLLEKHKAKREEPTVFSLHEIVDELVGELSAQQKNHGTRFVKNYHHSQILLTGTPNRLQRAIGNLMKNAVEALKGKGTIEVQTTIKNGNIGVAICDNGCGMDAETLQKVRQGGHSQGKADGHGIGLGVVREVASEWGGTFDFESEIRKGTKAILTLPQSGELPSSSYEVRVGGDRTILVIDDDPSMRKRWRMILQGKSCEVVTFDSYEDLTSASPPSITTAIVDFQFSNSSKNGWDVIDWLQKNGASHLYLCTSDYWRPALRKRASELGIPVFPKPPPEVQVKSSVGVTHAATTSS